MNNSTILCKPITFLSEFDYKCLSILLMHSCTYNNARKLYSIIMLIKHQVNHAENIRIFRRPLKGQCTLIEKLGSCANCMAACIIYLQQPKKLASYSLMWLHVTTT